jgi:hypothetical protein
MSISREKVFSTIRAIMAKTMDNGCTEAEAMSALEKARVMMDAYEVTAEDLAFDSEKPSIVNDALFDPHGIRSNLCGSVSRFCDVQSWRDTYTGTRSWCGFSGDVEFAKWLLETLATFVERELAAHLAASNEPKGERRRLINGFVIGCTNRISERLREMMPNRATISSNSNALIVSKQGMIKAALDAAGIKLRSSRSRRVINFGSLNAGRSAGNDASFNRPVGDENATRRLR